jgi:hypothetical protein
VSTELYVRGRVVGVQGGVGRKSNQEKGWNTLHIFYLTNPYICNP